MIVLFYQKNFTVASPSLLLFAVVVLARFSCSAYLSLLNFMDQYIVTQFVLDLNILSRTFSVTPIFPLSFLSRMTQNMDGTTGFHMELNGFLFIIFRSSLIQLLISQNVILARLSYGTELSRMQLD